MILEKITKGNFNLELTKKTYKHENNLRFHVKIDERFYEYAIDTWNKHTINLQCVVYERKKIQGRVDQKRCYGRITIKIGGRLKTQPKNCNSKKPKYDWNEKNVFDDYLDLRNYVKT